MNKQEVKAILELSDLLFDMTVYAEKMDFCNTRLMELSEVSEYDEYEETDRPLYFWNARERIQKYTEIQNDYYNGKVLPMIEKAQGILQALLDKAKET